jgi:hypothetical protein
MAKDKLNNLVSFSDFTNNWKSEGAKKTPRTDTGLDVLAQKASGVDVETKKAVDKSTTAPGNGLSKIVVK